MSVLRFPLSLPAGSLPSKKRATCFPGKHHVAFSVPFDTSGDHYTKRVALLRFGLTSVSLHEIWQDRSARAEEPAHGVSAERLQEETHWAINVLRYVMYVLADRYGLRQKDRALRELTKNVTPLEPEEQKALETFFSHIAFRIEANDFSGLALPLIQAMVSRLTDIQELQKNQLWDQANDMALFTVSELMEDWVSKHKLDGSWLPYGIWGNCYYDVPIANYHRLEVYPDKTVRSLSVQRGMQPSPRGLNGCTAQKTAFPQTPMSVFEKKRTPAF